MMKKLIYTFSALALIFTSCSKDDSAANQNNILVKRITYVSSGNSSALDFKYNGNKLVNVYASGVDSFKETYTYTGDLITKVERYTNTGSDYALNTTRDYKYTNGKLVNFTERYPNESYYFETVYTHNNDGTITCVKSKIYPDVSPTTGTFIGKVTISNGNWVKNDKSTDNYVGMITYEYDTKNSPTKNILGYNLLLNKEEKNVSVNNLVKTTDVRGDYYTGVFENTYAYNGNDFPTERKSYNGNLLVTTNQYFY